MLLNGNIETSHSTIGLYNAGKIVSGTVLERGKFEPYPMIRRKFSEAKNKPGMILTSY
ncbi:MAG: hypothetical protein UV70_C0008G0033 [Parcubacteria group bacterium GW2011_GWA2_43_13]|nr:MAG: hypothetical protein UV70_C0008G0033 [Parcubacteria group bacterium GW2011_GWA2_43_13]